MRRIKVKITAVVETTIELNDDETTTDVLNRQVDIYLHGANNNELDKIDLGTDSYTIEKVSPIKNGVKLWKDTMRG